jgi:DNA-binding transcriptional LysR family regulator
VDAVVGGRLDVGLVSFHMANPYVDAEPFAEHGVVCIMPARHPLAARPVVSPADLAPFPHVAFGPETAMGQRVAAVLDAHGVTPDVAVVTNVAPTLCEFVAAGTGVALVHPLMVGDPGRVAVRAFEPRLSLGFLLVRAREGRNARLVDDFIGTTHSTAAAMLEEASAPRKASERQRSRR